MKKAKFNLQFYKNYKFVWLPYFIKQKLMWKDKFATPRCERIPYFRFEWLWFGIYGEWGEDQYWEQWLWIHKYHGGDEVKAEKEWGWTDMKTKKSSWKHY